MKRPEEAIHRAIVQWLRLTKPNCIWWHTPNGARLTKAQAGIHKALGMTAGVPDLVFILPRTPQTFQRASVAFLEIKAPGNKLTKTQQEFRDAVLKLGARYETVWSLDGAMKVVSGWTQ